MQTQEETGNKSSIQSGGGDSGSIPRREGYQSGGGSVNSSRSSSETSRFDQRTGTGDNRGTGDGRYSRDFKPGEGRFSTGGGGGRTPYLGRRRFVFRKKECHYTKNNISYVDYKDVTTLKMFVGYSGQVLASRFTGLSPKYQRAVSKAVKRARFMALLPFVGEVKKSSYRRDDRRNDFRGGDGRNDFRGGDGRNYDGRGFDNRNDASKSTSDDATKSDAGVDAAKSEEVVDKDASADKE